MCRKTIFSRIGPSFIRAAACLSVAFFTAPASAQVYKCVDDAGNLTFSQVPCPGQSTSKVGTGAKRTSDTDCSWATRFARDVARRMQSGRTSDQTFGAYGGVDAVSSGTLNLINYVYRYQHASDVSVDRIASLTGSMCSAGSLGDVSCEALPFNEYDDPDRCEENGTEDEADDGASAAAAATVGAAERRPAAAPAPAASSAQADRSEAVESCKQPVRDKIDAINESMRSGYDPARGERYREELRELSRRYRDCDRL